MSNNKPFIPVLESRKHLAKKEEKVLPTKQLGTTYTMVQQACWLDSEHFAVGRWDGSFSIFNKTVSPTQGALIDFAITTPADQGVQMISWLAPKTFITSNDDQSMAIWKSVDTSFEDIELINELAYDSTYGIANSATVVQLGSKLVLATGHEAGYALIWTADTGKTDFELTKTVDLRSQYPTNPWGLQNIRAIQCFLSESDIAYAITGSENGQLCVVTLPDGIIKSRTVYNADAKRGINSVSALGQNILVANCSVGSKDKNLWFYWIDRNDWSVNLRDSKNLVVDTSRDQVFNFCVEWGLYGNGICFFSATEEGVLWMGTIENNSSLDLFGYEPVAVADLGAALASSPNNLVYAAYNVSAFDTGAVEKPKPNVNPNYINLELLYSSFQQ